MALQVLSPALLVNCHFAENDTSHSIPYTRMTDIETSYDAPSMNFFKEEIDMTSEVMSFLDVESLLNLCQASKVFPSCLRHDHVITSALSTAAPLQLASTSLPITPAVSKSMFALSKDEKKPQQHNHEKKDQRDEQQCQEHLVVEQTREYTTMKRLLQVYEKYNSLNSSNKKSGTLSTIAMQNVERPSPMRLLRLVNAKKCEKCNRRLAPSSNGGSLVLPSLTFGKFCCTKCLFK